MLPVTAHVFLFMKMEGPHSVLSVVLLMNQKRGKTAHAAQKQAAAAYAAKAL